MDARALVTLRRIATVWGCPGADCITDEPGTHVLARETDGARLLVVKAAPSGNVQAVLAEVALCPEPPERVVAVLPGDGRRFPKLLKASDIDVWTENELLFDRTRQCNQEVFQVLGKEEADRFLGCISARAEQLPKLPRRDPMARYFGFRRGSVVRATAHSETGDMTYCMLVT